MRCLDLNAKPEDCIDFTSDSPGSLPFQMYLYIIRIHHLRLRNENVDRAAVQAILKAIPTLQNFVKLFGQYSPVDQGKTLAHGLAIYQEHLTKLKAISEEQALNKGICIKQLSATVPKHWDSWMRNFFICILQDVWYDMEPRNIGLWNESQAAAYWVMYLNSHTRRARPQEMVLVDFSGYTLVCIFYCIRWNDTKLMLVSEPGNLPDHLPR